MNTEMRSARISLRGREAGFTVVEILVAMTLFAIISLFVLQAFVAGMGYSGQSNTRAAATTLGLQAMEQIKASVNPYTMVGFVPVARQNLPLPAPYSGITNPTGYQFQMAVTVTANDDLTLTTVTVEVYRPSDTTPYVTLSTVLDDQ